MRVDEHTITPTTETGANSSGSSADLGKFGQRQAWPVAILGVPVDNLTRQEALERLKAMVATRQPHYVVTVNVDFLVQARRDPELHRVLLDADLVLCDGTPLVWAARWLGNPLPERVAGSDLLPALVELAAQEGYRLFFLGGAPEVTAQAVTNLQRDHPQLRIAGHYSPPFRPLPEMDHEDILRRIRAVEPDILLVSFGCPKAEKWMAGHYRALGVPVLMGVGGTIDFLAGRIQRAPRWMRAAGLEWTYRLWHEPRRLFRRYLSDLSRFPAALLQQCWQAWWPPWSAGGPATPARVLVNGSWQRAQAPARLDAPSVRRDRGFWTELANSSRNCLLELGQVKRLDGTGAALLIQLQKALRRNQRGLVLLRPSPKVQRTLARLHLSNYFTCAADALEARQMVRRLLTPTALPERSQ